MSRHMCRQRFRFNYHDWLSLQTNDWSFNWGLVVNYRGTYFQIIFQQRRRSTILELRTKLYIHLFCTLNIWRTVVGRWRRLRRGRHITKLFRRRCNRQPIAYVYSSSQRRQPTCLFNQCFDGTKQLNSNHYAQLRAHANHANHAGIQT